MRQIPDGPSDLVCPLHRDKMSKRCKVCPLWVQVRGKNPNTGEETDQWNCSLAWLPLLLIETAKEIRQGVAATESFRNEMVRRSDEAVAQQRLALRRANNGIQVPLLIESD